MTRCGCVANINKITAILIFIACFLLLFPSLSSVSAKADSLLNLSGLVVDGDHSCSNESHFPEKNKTENIPYCQTAPCSSNSCCNSLAVPSLSVINTPIQLIGTYLTYTEQFYTSDLIYSIFKPPKI